MKIFISYEHNVWPLAKTLAEWIKPHGHDVYWDFESLRHGMEFDKTIAGLIADSDQVLFLASPLAIQSRWVASELAYARALQKPILPIKLENVSNQQIESMPFIGKVHIFDWATNKDVSNDLVLAISRLSFHDLIQITISKNDDESCKVDIVNTLPVDLYDLRLSVYFEMTAPDKSRAMSERQDAHILKIGRGDSVWLKFKYDKFLFKELDSKERYRKFFFEENSEAVILCKFSFQNQERNFYVVKNLKIAN